MTDFTLIKAGALHRANGGYLILQAGDVLSGLQSWEALKRVLKTREIRIENLGERVGLITMSTLRPQPIPLAVKVVMIGSPYLYHLLYYYDEDFRKLFKIKADFDVEMERNDLNCEKMADLSPSTASGKGCAPLIVLPWPGSLNSAPGRPDTRKAEHPL